MSSVRKTAGRLLRATGALALLATPAAANANAPGGVASPAAAVPVAPATGSGGAQAPSAPLAGGVQYGVLAPLAERPFVSELEVPTTAVAGKPPPVRFRIDEAGVATVAVRVTVTDLSTRTPVIVLAIGWVDTGRTLTVSWPARARLRPGSYHVSLTAHDHHSGTLLRRAHSSGVASMKVTAAGVPPPTSATPAPTAGVPTPAETAADGAVFPVAGAHNFGGPENRFGAPRDGYTHQGQDVLTAEGTPIVVPLAGAITTASYQAGGAGYYAVEHTTVGLDFMFAHCKASSLAVAAEQAVAAGQQLCLAGQTGDATAPHLHFEIWVGGWRAPGGYPIDPLPYLEAWEHAGSGA